MAGKPKEKILFVKGIDRQTMESCQRAAKDAGMLWRAWVAQALSEKLARTQP